MKKLVVLLMVVSMVCVASATTVWNPFANGHGPAPATAPFEDALNWTAGTPGAPDNKAVFNVPNAADAVVTTSLTGFYLVQGDGADGGTITVANGGHLDISTTNAWSAVGWNNTAYMNVEAGGIVTFNQAWIGFNAGGVGTVDVSGTMNVNNMFGLGWNGGDGYVNVLDGGVLALSNIHGDGSTSIKQNSILDIIGTGQVTLPGNFIGVIDTYAANGLIAGNGVIGAVSADLDLNGDTVVTAIPEPATMMLLGLGGLLIRRKK